MFLCHDFMKELNDKIFTLKSLRTINEPISQVNNKEGIVNSTASKEVKE